MKRKYLISDESSWVKNQNKDELGNPIRVIWNGAKEEDHRSSGANGYSNPAAPAPAPPTGPTKQLAVLSSFVPGALTLDWLFLEADYEQGVGCREDFLRPFDTVPWDLSGNGAQDGSTFPGGTRELDLTIDGEKCQYQNDGDDAGALWCGKKVIGCKNDSADKDPNDSTADKGNYQCGDYTRQPVFVCPY
ncbi:hypothetical protein N0V83_006340 [Neocucurbitaria cava]|uniref:Uncharacterized protein n=1 Tax=Neocucurbitaria cava TaxID=798079 RepID=A0A9W9CLW9_9PLEO|nr:hypothetical protein N0V83_006340 [Neocucurbitaria cava]